MKPFLVLKLPRTGSSMFGKVLDSHPSVDCVNEFLTRYRAAPRRVKVRALRSFYRDRSNDDPGRAVGQTMNPFTYGLKSYDVASALEPRRGLIRRPGGLRHGDAPLQLIVLLRENLLKQSVSAYFAHQRGKWESSRHLIDDPSAFESQVIDVAELTRMVARMRVRSERLRQFAVELRGNTMHVTYEQLQNDPKGIFESVFSHLSVPSGQRGFDYTAGFTKVRSDDLRDVVTNFADIEGHPLLSSYL
jgi:LPS sulfotransferase NodH